MPSGVRLFLEATPPFLLLSSFFLSIDPAVCWAAMEWHQLLLLLFYVVKQTVTTSMRLKCGDTIISGSLEPARTPPVALLNKEFKPWRGDICGPEPVHSSYIVCRDKCDYDCLQNVNGTHLIISKRHTFDGIRALWYRYEGEFVGVKTSCIMTEETGDSSTSTDALRSFSKTSVLFVSISFIILMVISLAWLVFYYVQRFRYAHAKDRLQRRLFNAARKALARIPTRALRVGDIELDTDCAVCIDPYQASDVVRTLPCRHVYHKSCIDPWLLEHRTCPMCKADILKYFGYQVSAGDASRVEIERDAHEHDSESPEPASSSSDSIAFPFPTNSPHDPFHFAPVIAPQLVMNQATAKSFAIVPLTVHPKPAHGRDITDIEQPSTSSSVERPDRASSAGAVDKSAGRSLQSRAGSQGQVVNIVQVRSRAQSCTRPVAVTIRKHERQPQPTAVEQETTEPV